MLRISFGVGLFFALGLIQASQNANAQILGNPNTFAQRYISGRPTLSPYLNLTRSDRNPGTGLPDYHSLVRPALEQRRRDSESRQRDAQLQREALAARSRESRRPITSPGIRSTGHPSRFRNFLHFYPKFGR